MHDFKEGDYVIFVDDEKQSINIITKLSSTNNRQVWVEDVADRSNSGWSYVGWLKRVSVEDGDITYG